MRNFKIEEYFDDIVEDEMSVWSQVCPECAQKYKAMGNIEWDGGPYTGVICGVKGCCNEAEYYITFYVREQKNEK